MHQQCSEGENRLLHYWCWHLDRSPLKWTLVKNKGDDGDQSVAIPPGDQQLLCPSLGAPSSSQGGATVWVSDRMALKKKVSLSDTLWADCKVELRQMHNGMDWCCSVMAVSSTKHKKDPFFSQNNWSAENYFGTLKWSPLIWISAVMNQSSGWIRGWNCLIIVWRTFHMLASVMLFLQLFAIVDKHWWWQK